VAWALVNVLVSTGITALVFVVTSRVLSPGDFGLVALAISVVMLVSCLMPFGFGDAMIQRAELQDRHLDVVFWACSLSGVVAYVLLLLNAGRLATWVDAPGIEPVLALIGTRMVFDGLSVAPGSLMRRQLRYRSFALRTAIANGLGGVVCLSLIWAGAGYWALAAAPVVGSAANCVVVAAMCGWTPRLKFNRAAFRDLRSFALAASATRAIGEVRLDQIVLGAVAGPVVLGLYFFSRRILQMLSDVTAGAFGSVMGVLFASLQGEPETSRRAFLLAGFATALMGFPIFVGLFVVADTALPLVFGAQWTAAVLAVRASCLIGIMAVIGTTQATLINGHGHAGWWLGYHATDQLLAPIIVLVAYPLGGLDAVMVALVVRTVLLWPLAVRKTLQILDLSLGAYLGSLVRPLLAALAMAAAVAAVPLAAPSVAGWARLGVEVVVGAASYALAALLVGGGRIRELATAARRGPGT
jgi:O-antigen/teichoic acid export membrane protein